MNPTEITVSGIPFVLRDFKRELSGRLLLKGLAAITILTRNDSLRGILSSGGATITTIVDALNIAPDVLASEEYKDLFTVLFVPKDPQDEKYAALSEKEKRELALDAPIYQAYEAIKSFFVSTKNAGGSSVTTSAETA